MEDLALNLLYHYIMNQCTTINIVVVSLKYAFLKIYFLSHNIDLYIYVCFCFHNKRLNIWYSNMLQFQSSPPGVTVILPCLLRTSVQQRDICGSKLIYFVSFQVLLLFMDTVGHYLMYLFDFFKD